MHKARLIKTGFEEVGVEEYQWAAQRLDLNHKLLSNLVECNKQGQLHLSMQQAYIGEITKCQWCQHTAVHILLTSSTYRHAGLGYIGCFPVNSLC